MVIGRHEQTLSRLVLDRPNLIWLILFDWHRVFGSLDAASCHRSYHQAFAIFIDK